MDNKVLKILNISSDAKRTVDNIDKRKFLNLDNKNCSRMKLFTFALALGVVSDTETDLTKTETFVRNEYINTKYEAYLYAVYIYSLKSKDDLDEVSDIKKVYGKIQRYANTGFLILDDMLQKQEDIARLEIIKELDMIYEQYKDEF